MIGGRKRKRKRVAISSSDDDSKSDTLEDVTFVENRSRSSPSNPDLRSAANSIYAIAPLAKLSFDSRQTSTKFSPPSVDDPFPTGIASREPAARVRDDSLLSSTIVDTGDANWVSKRARVGFVSWLSSCLTICSGSQPTSSQRSIPRLCILLGPSASGKSTLIRATARDLGVQIVEFHPPTLFLPRSLDGCVHSPYSPLISELRSFLFRGSSYPSLFGANASHVLVIEDLPFPLPLPAELSSLLINASRRARFPIVFAFTTPEGEANVSFSSKGFQSSEFDESDTPLNSSQDLLSSPFVFHVVLKSPSVVAVTKAMRSAFPEVSGMFLSGQLDDIISMVPGDMRGAMNIMQFLQGGQGSAKSTILSQTRSLSWFHLIGRFLNAGRKGMLFDPFDLLSYSLLDRSSSLRFISWIHEHVLSYVPASDDPLRELEDSIVALEAISDADVFMDWESTTNGAIDLAGPIICSLGCVRATKRAPTRFAPLHAPKNTTADVRLMLADVNACCARNLRSESLRGTFGGRGRVDRAIMVEYIPYGEMINRGNRAPDQWYKFTRQEVIDNENGDCAELEDDAIEEFSD